MKSCHIFIEFRLYKGYIKFDQLDLLGIQLSISFDTIFTTNVIFLGPILGSILVFPQPPQALFAWHSGARHVSPFGCNSCELKVASHERSCARRSDPFVLGPHATFGSSFRWCQRGRGRNAMNWWRNLTGWFENELQSLPQPCAT